MVKKIFLPLGTEDPRYHPISVPPLGNTLSKCSVLATKHFLITQGPTEYTPSFYPATPGRPSTVISAGLAPLADSL